jgi:hypothetical protein
MTDQEQWQQDWEEMQIFLMLFFVESWIAFWWCVEHIG